MLDHAGGAGASPARAPMDIPAAVALQNFKAASATVTIHHAHYFAVQGYRVLAVACDSQAMTTTLLGFNPRFNITPGKRPILTSRLPPPKPTCSMR